MKNGIMIRLLFDIDNKRSLEKSLEVTELIFFQDEPTLNTKKMQLYIFVRFHHCGDFFFNYSSTERSLSHYWYKRSSKSVKFPTLMMFFEVKSVSNLPLC